MDRIPILKVGNILLVSIRVDMDDITVQNLHDDLCEDIVKKRAQGVLIDISSLDMVDSYIGHMLGTIASTSSILGAVTVVAGMRPAVALTMVELGLTLKNVKTALNIELGIVEINNLIQVQGAT